MSGGRLGCAGAEPRGRLPARRGERGAVAALVALYLPCLLAALALVADLGVLLLARAELSAAADFGALAAVQDLDLELLARGEVVVSATDAVRDARAWTEANLAAATFLDPASVDISVTVLNPSRARDAACPVSGQPVAWPTVCVVVSATVRLPFAPGLGPVRVSAHADASVVGRP